MKFTALVGQRRNARPQVFNNKQIMTQTDIDRLIIQTCTEIKKVINQKIQTSHTLRTFIAVQMKRLAAMEFQT